MYKIMSALSVLIRQFLLPNPFEPLGDKLSIQYFGVDFHIPPLFINIIAEPVLFALAYSITGLYYFSGSDHPAKGSFLYLFFYSFHVGLLYIMSYFGFTKMIIVIVVSGYVLLHIGLAVLRNHLSGRYWRY